MVKKNYVFILHAYTISARPRIVVVFIVRYYIIIISVGGAMVARKGPQRWRLCVVDEKIIIKDRR